jgi:hypothetical protein
VAIPHTTAIVATITAHPTRIDPPYHPALWGPF